MFTLHNLRAAALRGDLLGLGRFVLRCAASAMLAYLLALHLHLPNPVWAPVSALVVSQERLSATHCSIVARFIGTIFGALVALSVHEIGKIFDASVVADVGVAVAICAVCAKIRPDLRVCLWTCPLVLLSATTGMSDSLAATCRAAEVIVGAGVAGLLHLVEDGTVTRLILWVRMLRITAWRGRRVHGRPA